MKKSILFVSKNMNVGGVEKSLLSLLGTMSPDEYDVDLLLLENYGGFMEFIPNWVNVSFADWYGEMRDEVNKPPLGVIKDHIRNGRVRRGLSLGIGYALSKITGNNSHYYRRVFKNVPGLEKKYYTAVAYSSIINCISWYTVHKVTAEKKVGWIHFDVSKCGCDRKITGYLHSKMDKIYVVSEEAYNSFIKFFPSLEIITEVRYNIVSNIEIIRMSDDPSVNIREPGRVIISTLGRLSPEKGQDIIPDVAKILKDTGIRFRWYLIGDGSLRDVIQEKISSLGLNDEVRLVGTKVNPYPFLKQTDIYVQTSVHEGFCITLAEAKAFGMPIISTDFSGAHEQLDGLVGCAVVERDPEKLASAVSDQINNKVK